MKRRLPWKIAVKLDFACPFYLPVTDASDPQALNQCQHLPMACIQEPAEYAVDQWKRLGSPPAVSVEHQAETHIGHVASEFVVCSSPVE